MRQIFKKLPGWLLTAAGKTSEIFDKNDLEQDYTFRFFCLKERINQILSELKPEYKNKLNKAGAWYATKIISFFHYFTLLDS